MGQNLVQLFIFTYDDKLLVSVKNPKKTPLVAGLGVTN